MIEPQSPAPHGPGEIDAAPLSLLGAPPHQRHFEQREASPREAPRLAALSHTPRRRFAGHEI
jgi:hypothetical protein